MRLYFIIFFAEKCFPRFGLIHYNYYLSMRIWENANLHSTLSRRPICLDESNDSISLRFSSSSSRKYFPFFASSNRTSVGKKIDFTSAGSKNEIFADSAAEYSLLNKIFAFNPQPAKKKSISVIKCKRPAIEVTAEH